MDVVSLGLAKADAAKKYAPKGLRRSMLAGYKGLATALATAPTITTGVAGTTTSSIASSTKVWADRQDAFAYNVPPSLLAFASAFPDSNYLVPMAGAGANNTTSSKVTPPLRASFYYYGQKFEIAVKNVAGYQLTIDGATSTAVVVSHDTNMYVDLIDFGTVGYRRIDIDFSSTTARFGGLFIEPTGTVTAAATRQPRVCVVSDSFGEGTGATNSWSSWVYTLAALGGWTPWSSSWGGTGYLNPGSGRTKIRDRLAADVLNGSPDVIIWAAGYNEYAGTYTAAATGAEALACFQATKAALPNVAQYVVGPWWHNGARTMPTLLLDIKDAIKASAAQVGAPYLDVLEMPVPLQGAGVSGTLSAASIAGATSVSLSARPGALGGAGSSGVTMVVEIGTGSVRERRIATTYSGSGPFTVNLDGALSNAHASGEPFKIVGPPLWTGTGHASALANNGNSDLLVYTDGVHPTQAGHDAIGRAVYELLAAALPA